MHTVRDLRPDELPLAVDLLVRAFDEDPALRWLVPDDDARRRVAPVLATAWVTYALRWGRVWCTDRVEAVALRRPPGAEHLHAWRLLACGFWRVPFVLGIAGTLRLLRAGAAADARHRAGMPGPHWYCWLLAVHPDHQGEGLSTALVDHTFARADADGVPCWLESTNLRAVRVHRHHGWQVHGAAPVPGTSLQVWTMIRRPARVARQGAKWRAIAASASDTPDFVDIRATKAGRGNEGTASSS
jgi:GNAT superfamily N-acetyltransferase